MTKREKQIRERIMDVTIELIQKYGDTNMITIREIASSAEVGVAMINYHFQTKDNLINMCIMKMIQSTIGQLELYSQNADLNPLDKIRELGKGIAAFMVSNPGFSKISMTNDIISASESDNSAQIIKMLFPLVKEIYGDKKSDQEVSFMLHMLVSSIVLGFLRQDVLKPLMALDFKDTKQRDDFVEFCISQILHE